MRDHYEAADVEAISLRGVGLGSEVVRQAEFWIRAMTLAHDNEPGEDFVTEQGERVPGFWGWIVSHHLRRLADSDPLFDTYFLVKKEGGTVVATGSITDDDRDVGLTYGMPGIWFGGINVRREYRGRGLGSLMLSHRERQVEQAARERGEPIRVNLFTSVEWSGWYARRGYQREGSIDVDPWKGEVRFSRIFA
jgi:GNAT superfamily N-acetyltransferase